MKFPEIFITFPPTFREQKNPSQIEALDVEPGVLFPNRPNHQTASLNYYPWRGIKADGNEPAGKSHENFCDPWCKIFE